MPLDSLLKSPQAKQTLTGFLSGAAGGALAGQLTRKKSARKLLKAGGLVALGGVAWQAYRTYQYRATHCSSNAESSKTESVSQLMEQVGMSEFRGITPAESGCVVADEELLIILKTMVAAAHADGRLSDTESSQIWQRAIAAEISESGLAELDTLLHNPAEVSFLAAQAVSLEQKVEMYAAAACVLDEGCAAGGQFLQELASALRLPQGLTASIRFQLKTTPTALHQ